MTLDREIKYFFKQARDSRLSLDFEPDAYVVAHKDGNAVVLQDAKGNCKMCNISSLLILQPKK